MKKTAQISQNLLTKSLLGLLFVTGCTKKIPQQNLSAVEKQDVVAASNFDTQADYLYSSSQQNASRSAADALPFSSGDNKRVKIQMLEKSMRIVEVERDQRFQDNQTNNKVLLEIPVDHIQYQCAKDRYGECTNTEEEAKDVPWQNRDHVRIKFEEAKAGEIDLLPIVGSKDLGDDCYEEVSSRLIESKIEKEAINFRVERVFKTKLDCLPEQAMSLTDSSISAVYHYSLVKTSSVLTQGFKTISYPADSSDENSFGFFSSKSAVLDVDNNMTQRSLRQVMNHWNPNRKVIEYHLSDEFAKPENKTIKELTYKTFDNLNQGLSEAGVNFRLHLNEPSGKVPGDIRNSMIVLVEDPVASSVIGYGPQTEDPVTGEIISARTIMFLGTIKKYIKYTYDEIIRERQSEARNATKALTANLKLSSDLLKLNQSLITANKLQDVTSVQDSFNKLMLMQSNDSAQVDQLVSSQKATGVSQIINQGAGKISDAVIQKIKHDLNNYTSRKNDIYNITDKKSHFKYLNEAKNCAFTPNLNGVASKVSTKLLQQFDVEAKPWAELSEDQREKVIEIILPEIWIPTLIHEVGHNLGLRHNFAASEDAENQYTNQELASRGIDHKIPFSSVMDYGNDLKTLTVLGKYDIAALKFGYLRQVEVVDADGQSKGFVPVESTLDEAIAHANTAKNSDNTKKFDVQVFAKKYDYCTDENLGLSSGCKQFDLGVTKTEIVQNLIQDYLDAYSKRNLRQDRISFSLFEESAYISRVKQVFDEMRAMMETKELIQNIYQIPDSHEVWNKNDFLKDIKTATELSGLFMANVVLTPDVTCAVALKGNESEIVELLSLKTLNQIQASNFINCFDYQFYDSKMANQYVIVAQTGKSLNSLKDQNSKVPGESEIDVRGIWADKAIALDTLMKRTIGSPSFDKYNDNFLATDVTRDAILKMLTAITSNNTVGKLTFTTRNGLTQDLPVKYDLGDSQIIEKPFFMTLVDGSSLPEIVKKQYADKFLGVRNQTSLQTLVARKINSGAYDQLGQHPEDSQLVSALEVSRYDANLKLKFADKIKTAVIENTLYAANTSNVMALQAMTNLEKVQKLDKLTNEQLQNIMKLKSSGAKNPDAKMSVEEKEAFKLSLDDMNDYANGILQTEQFYTSFLKGLPVAN